MSGGAGWIAGQLLRLADARSAMPLQCPRYNPHPPGVIWQGSASDAVLSYLEAHPGRWSTSAELIVSTGRTHAAVSWALVYLRSLGAIEAATDAARNPRYLKYRMRRKTR